MPVLSRRSFLVSAGAFAAIPPARAQPADPLQRWLADHAVRLRTIDMASDDFDDLAPLAAAIGDARIVQLGEPGHGAGSSFAAKARLVKFLHRRMGFGVLVWESGFYDLEQVRAAMRTGEDPVAAAQRGVMRIWSASEQCRPLFAYAQASQARPRSLEMAGYDMQFTAEGSFDLFAAELRAAVADMAGGGEAGARALAERAIASFGRLQAYGAGRARKAGELARTVAAGAARAEAMAAWESGEGAALRADRSDLARLEQSAEPLAALLRRERDRLAGTTRGRRPNFLAQAVDNLAGYGANLHERHGADRPPGAGGATVASENRRDALNAANLRWLTTHAYPGRKLIVWAHNAHVMNAYYGPDWASVSTAPRDGWMKPTGVLLKERLGEDVYTIGMTTYSGEDGFAAPIPATPIPPASDASLEGRLHALGAPYSFLDLRRARGRGGPMTGPQLMRLPKYEEELVDDPTQPFDGLLFIDRMERAVRAGAAASASAPARG